MAGRLIIQKPPQLFAPHIMVGMNGWLNAGEISTGSIGFLRHKPNTKVCVHRDPGFLYLSDPQLVWGVDHSASHPNSRRAGHEA
jgi:hypothetical protein